METPEYQPLLISFAEAEALRHELGRDSLMGRSLQAERAVLERYMAAPIEIPGHGEAGGYEHNRHKQNYIHLNLAGRLFLITREPRFLDYARDMLLAYAEAYLDIPLNTSRDSNKPGRLFHQTLNENMWLLYAAEAYSCIRYRLSDAQRALVEQRLFRPMVALFSETYAHDFDIVHNHGLWSVASVGMCGYAIGDQSIVDRALYGLRGDSSSGGFLAQLAQLFSPDGYYIEGPYYHRFAIRPLLLFAEAIERRQPGLAIYQFKQQVIRRTTEALMSLAFPDGTFPALNDASKTMGIRDEGLMIATSLCFWRYGADTKLIAMARLQDRVWVGGAGLALSDAALTQPPAQLNWGSVQLSDGPDGQRGGVGILRQADAEGDLDMALMWYGQHGSDHTLHDALDHGHFDGLHLSFFNRGREVLHDYGFGRWVNVEPKFGGRYIPENDSYCKQTIAHNTVVVDEASQNGGDTATATARWGEKHFFVGTHPAGQGMSARLHAYYPGVDMQRSVLLLNLPGLEKPLLLDLYRLVSEQVHQYDYPLHYQGQIIRSDFPFTTHATLAPLGRQAGYQHLWEVGRSPLLPAGGSALLSWLDGGSYYSALCATPAPGEMIFARIGANDPQFNLRNEPLLVLRTRAASHLFATALETHGHFDEANEISVDARGRLQRIEVLGHDATASVVRLHDVAGLRHTVMLSNLTGVDAQTYHEVTLAGETFRWQGAFAVTST
ncbi:MAG: chondroitin lyase [Candidatus Dactylopiibacterium carminicum]|uniref:Chondroitin lyase n=2 Tax=Candidatus Dactylopiibacterium carminicum TaxID=857335 RepID=A0A272ESB0_9RHOO|nr:chondroitin lyase [Candidatus Dactylopiibacterium carminicum]PAS93001.1 MAG: chondroitin lyase [Candidatus Dactylopiibacterium carminicum]PAT00771.1 MAG: chondroitin lyase [Candidatus Dactylopiibacterium carminicum]